MIGLNFTIETSGEEEIQPHGLPPAEFVKTLALQKAQPVADLHPEDCVIGADTIVYLEGDILGKPHTPDVAKAYLNRMQGKSHVVFTGVAVLKDGKADVRHCETKVTFAPMTEREIDAYVATGEPQRVAGGFTIDGIGGAYVTAIEGDPFNVVGLSLPLVRQMVIDAGVRWESLWINAR